MDLKTVGDDKMREIERKIEQVSGRMEDLVEHGEQPTSIDGPKVLWEPDTPELLTVESALASASPEERLDLTEALYTIFRQGRHLPKGAQLFGDVGDISKYAHMGTLTSCSGKSQFRIWYGAIGGLEVPHMDSDSGKGVLLEVYGTLSETEKYASTLMPKLFEERIRLREDFRGSGYVDLMIRGLEGFLSAGKVKHGHVL